MAEAICIHIQVARVPRLIHFEVGDEFMRKDMEGCLEGGGKEIRMVGEEGVGEGVGKEGEDGDGVGVGKEDEDGGGHGGGGRRWGRSWGRRWGWR